MGKHGFFKDLCRSLDCMEEEMRGLCRCFHKKEKSCDVQKKSCCELLCEFCLPPDFRPPCGKEKCCCEKKK